MYKKLVFMLMVLFGSCMQAQAGIVAWSGSALVGDGTADISTVGTLIEAHNIGSSSGISAGGVLFDGAEPFAFANNFSFANPGSITTDASFDAILNSATWEISAETYTIDGLTSGQNYLAQFFTVDSRGCCSARTTKLDDGMGNSITSSAMGAGYAFTGLFTALGTTQSVNFSVSPANNFEIIPLFNAWQLRELTVRQVPEPGIIVLFGLGIVVFGFTLHKKV